MLDGTFARVTSQAGKTNSGFQVGCLSSLQCLVASGNEFFVCCIKSFIQSFKEPWQHLSEHRSQCKMKVRACAGLAKI